MRLSDLLKGRLDFSDSVTLEILDLFQRSPDNAKRLRINPSRGQQLVDLGILGLKTFLNSLMLLLQDQVPDSCLLVDLVDKSMELVKKFLLLFLEVFELLESYFKLPLDLLGGAVVV